MPASALRIALQIFAPAGDDAEGGRISITLPVQRHAAREQAKEGIA
jgi:hypothetical protein